MSSVVAAAAAVYTRYNDLTRTLPDGLGGSLLLAPLPAEPAASDPVTTLVRAGNIAGAATLLIAHDADAGRALVRSGVCDFLVTTLDEALRVLKNEIRRRRQVAVVLPGDRQTLLGACVERGVQPELLLGDTQPTLVARGARVLSPEPEQPPAEMVWWMASGSATAIERLAIASIGGQARAERLRWLARSPQYLGRELSRVRTLPLSDEETMRFCEAVRGDLVAGRVTGGVSVWRGGSELIGHRT